MTRALGVLRCFTAERTLLSVAEIGKDIRLSRPTLYRLLATLESAGFVQSEGDPLRFRLGAAIGPLVQAWSSNLNLQQVAAPVLAELRRDAEETVCLMVPRGNHRLCVAELPGPHMLTVLRGVGSSAPLDRGASGKVLLAYAGSRKAAGRDLGRIRRAGFAVSRGELQPGVVAIAVPVFDRNDGVVGAIAVYGAAVRFNERREREVARLAMDAGAKISQLLGQPR